MLSFLLRVLRRIFRAYEHTSKMHDCCCAEREVDAGSMKLYGDEPVTFAFTVNPYISHNNVSLSLSDLTALDAVCYVIPIL